MRVSAPVPQQGTLAPKIQSLNATMAKTGTSGQYDLWKGTVDFGVKATGRVTIEIIGWGRVVDTFLAGSCC